MIINRFQDALFYKAASDALGLSLYSYEDITDTTFHTDVAVGDFFLQYRRPSFRGCTRYVSPSPYTIDETLTLPAMLRYENLARPKVGFVNPTTEVAFPAFRIMRVFNVASSNDHCTSFSAHSVYSGHWGFRQLHPQAISSRKSDKWWDSYLTTSVYHRDLILRKGPPEESRGRTGIIGKFTDPDKLLEHFSKHTIIPAIGKYHTQGVTVYSPQRSFYPLWRALISDEPERPSVVATVKEYLSRESLV